MLSTSYRVKTNSNLQAKNIKGKNIKKIVYNFFLNLTRDFLLSRVTHNTTGKKYLWFAGLPIFKKIVVTKCGRFAEPTFCPSPKPKESGLLFFRVKYQGVSTFAPNFCIGGALSCGPSSRALLSR